MTAMALERRRLGAVAAAAGAALGVAALGAAATDLGPWYQALQKPWWQPPDWLFGPVWTLIYGLAALAGILAWQRLSDQAGRARILGMFGLNAVLNILWSELFFGLRRPDWALAEVVVLWLSVVALMVVLARVSRQAAWLLVPYLAWVTFAAALNLEVVRLNQPFGGP